MMGHTITILICSTELKISRKDAGDSDEENMQWILDADSG
jgi:hypothetical protein